MPPAIANATSAATAPGPGLRRPAEVVNCGIACLHLMFAVAGSAPCIAQTMRHAPVAPRAQARDEPAGGGAGRPGLRPMTSDLNPVTGAKDALLEPDRGGSWRSSGQFTDQGRTRTGHCRIRPPLALGLPERRRRLEGLSTDRARVSDCGPGSCTGLRLQDAALPISGVAAGKHALRRRSCTVRLHHEARKAIPASKTCAPRPRSLSLSPLFASMRSMASP